MTQHNRLSVSAAQSCVSATSDGKSQRIDLTDLVHRAHSEEATVDILARNTVLISLCRLKLDLSRLLNTWMAPQESYRDVSCFSSLILFYISVHGHCIRPLHGTIPTELWNSYMENLDPQSGE